MLRITPSRQRTLIVGLRFLLSVGSSWIQSAPATAATPHPLTVIMRAVEERVEVVFSAAADKKSARAMSVRRALDRH